MSANKLKFIERHERDSQCMSERGLGQITKLKAGPPPPP